jgi:hypothetical protein
VSNPVAPPPPSSGDGFPPPANQGFGSAPAPGQPYGAPPAAGQPYGAPPTGQPGGDPAQQGFGSPAALPPEPKKKSAVGRIILRIVGAIVVAGIIFFVKDQFLGDKAKNAAVGDCVASSKDVKVDEETDANAKVVDCASADAAFTVVGRVEGETNTQSKSCEKFFKENEEYYVYGSDAGGGYLLCLRPKAS